MADTDLPSELDFDPCQGDLDGQWAWKNFGGLTIEKAIQRFQEAPEIYQEDFMFMGPTAFAYYFPVLEAFLQGVPERTDDDDDHQAFILAHCIQNHFNANATGNVLRLAPRVAALSQYVRRNIERFASQPAEQAQISEVWLQLEEHVESHPEGKA